MGGDADDLARRADVVVLRPRRRRRPGTGTAVLAGRNRGGERDRKVSVGDRLEDRLEGRRGGVVEQEGSGAGWRRRGWRGW